MQQSGDRHLIRPRVTAQIGPIACVKRRMMGSKCHPHQAVQRERLGRHDQLDDRQLVKVCEEGRDAQHHDGLFQGRDVGRLHGMAMCLQIAQYSQCKQGVVQ